jgi:hypothetical protein
MDQIPIDILAVHILPNLGLVGLLRAKMVSKRWQLAAIRALKGYRMTKSEGYLASTIDDIGLDMLTDIPHKCLVKPSKASMGALIKAIGASKSIYIDGMHNIAINEVKLANISNLTYLSLTNMGDIDGQTLDNIITYSPNLSGLEIMYSSSCSGFNPVLMSRIKRLKLGGVSLNGVEHFLSVYNQANMLDYLYIQEAYVSQKALQCLKWAKELHYIYNGCEGRPMQEILALMELKNIRTLAIEKINDDELGVIVKNNRIDKIRLIDRITDKGLSYLQGIRSVYVCSNRITNQGLKYFNQAERISIVCHRDRDLSIINNGRTSPLKALLLAGKFDSISIGPLISPYMWD